MDAASDVQECQSRGTKRKRDEGDMSLVSTPYGMRLFSYLPPQAEQATSVDKSDGQLLFHWRYSQQDAPPRKKPKFEDKAASIIKKVLRSHSRDVQTETLNSSYKMKISNLLCGEDISAPERLSVPSEPLVKKEKHPKYQVVVKSNVHLQYSSHIMPVDGLNKTSSILDQINQKYSFPQQTSSEIHFQPVISFNYQKLTANSLLSSDRFYNRDVLLRDLKSFKEQNGLK